MRCSKVLDDGTQCPNTTKIKSARCWSEWGLCGKHASEDYPELYPKTRGAKTGGRFGKTNDTNSLTTIPIIITEARQAR